MLCLNYCRAIDFNSKYTIGEKMEKIFYIILISFVCLTINTCAEIDRSSESANSSLTEQIWSSAYDILVGTVLMSSDNLFAPEQTSTEKGGNYTPKNNNIFLVKQNSSGSREWIMDLGISDEESGISMTFDSSDNVYITGYTRNGLEGYKNSGDFRVCHRLELTHDFLSIHRIVLPHKNSFHSCVEYLTCKLLGVMS